MTVAKLENIWKKEYSSAENSCWGLNDSFADRTVSDFRALAAHDQVHAGDHDGVAHVLPAHHTEFKLPSLLLYPAQGLHALILDFVELLLRYVIGLDFLPQFRQGYELIFGMQLLVGD